MLVRLHVPYCNVINFLTERKKICDRDKKITKSMWSKVAAEVLMVIKLMGV